MRDDEEDAGGAGFGSECDVRCEIGAASLHLAFVRRAGVCGALYIALCVHVCTWALALCCVVRAFLFLQMYSSAERVSCHLRLKIQVACLSTSELSIK